MTDIATDTSEKQLELPPQPVTVNRQRIISKKDMGYADAPALQFKIDYVDTYPDGTVKLSGGVWKNVSDLDGEIRDLQNKIKELQEVSGTLGTLVTPPGPVKVLAG